MTKSNQKRVRSPHLKVFTRLGRSRLGGIGVFAIAKIKKNSSVFYGDDAEMVWIRRSAVANLPKKIRRLYEDFCVSRNGKYGCPKNFNLMTSAWYLNHSKRPNVRCSRDFKFFAIKDIESGEELTVNYETFNDEPISFRVRS